MGLTPETIPAANEREYTQMKVAAADPGRRLVIASYNIHRCIGTDGRHDPERVAEVICEIGADVVGLQEVSSRRHGTGIDQLELLARVTGYTAVEGPARRHEHGTYGNALLSRTTVRRSRLVDLTHARREPRGVIDAEIEVDGEAARFLVAHLGLSRRERHRQVRRILELVDGDRDRLVAVIGDFNEWIPLGRSVRRLDRRFGASPRRRTFPSRRPVFALDRIWVQPRTALQSVAIHASAAARRASDHLPLVAAVDLDRRR